VRHIQITGKGQTVSQFGKLFGASFVTASQASHVTTHFNGFLRTALLLFADEAAQTDPKTQGILKAMITEMSQLSESKGLDAKMARSFYDLWMASNSEDCIRLDNDDRRYFMPDVSRIYHGNEAFFEKLNADMVNGGSEALFSLLFHRDISNFRPRSRPTTSRSSALLFEQKYHSMDTVEQFIFHALHNEEPPFDRPGIKVSHSDLNAFFNVHRDASRDRGISVPSRTMIGKMKVIFKGAMIDHGCVNGKRFKSFLPLPLLRKAFADHYQAPASIFE